MVIVYSYLLSLTSHLCPQLVEENQPNSLGNEYRFRWRDEEGTEWRRLEHIKDNVVKLLCCDESGTICLADKSEIRPGNIYLYSISEASK